MGCHFLLQGIFPTQGSNPGLQHCRQTFYCLSHQGSLIFIRYILFKSWLICGFVLVLNVFLSFRYLFKGDAFWVCVIRKLDKVKIVNISLLNPVELYEGEFLGEWLFKSFCGYAIGGILELLLPGNGVWKPFLELLCHLHSSEIQLKIIRIEALKWNHYFTW